MVTLRVNLKHGNSVEEVFNTYDKAMIKVKDLDWVSLDVEFDNEIQRPADIEKISEYNGFDAYRSYKTSDWDAYLVFTELSMTKEFKC